MPLTDFTKAYEGPPTNPRIVSPASVGNAASGWGGRLN
jgi:hypothetical protein